jgi:hypothetical protein
MVVKLGLLRRLRIFKNRVLRNIFGAKREPSEYVGKKLLKEKVH